MKIAIVGIGYVGLSNAVLLSQNNSVVLLDIDQSKVDLINSKKSPIHEELIDSYLKKKKLDLSATVDKEIALKEKDIIIIATPTNFNPITNRFNTEIVDSVIEETRLINSTATIIIKSTVPIGYTDEVSNKYETNNIIFSPEFLREGSSLEDNLYPSRIILGQTSERSHQFASLLKEAAIKKDIEIIYTSNSEAESIKLFSNTYLAMRVAFFNELDSYALTHNLNTKHIIEGVCMDSRIGDGYNNPSFGYGGYCLPKDTKQILSNFEDIPQSLIAATVDSNQMRIEYIASCILKLKPSSVGFFRLAMKEGSDNFRSSSILGVIKIIEMVDIDTYIYEPRIDEGVFGNSKMIQDLDKFKSKSELIIANRNSIELNDCQKKVFTRDIFKVD